MSDPYLILHKVRGEPAFDIAEKFCQGTPCQPNCGLWNGDSCTAKEEDWWIIPTSGARAYPYWWYGPFGPEPTVEGPMLSIDMCVHIPIMDANWPDHYACNDRPTASTTEHKAFAKTLLEKLGLIKPTRVERRF